jgi:hypothetical protein
VHLQQNFTLRNKKARFEILKKYATLRRESAAKRAANQDCAK